MGEFKLVDSGWVNEIEQAIALQPASIRVVCPFIKLRSVQRLLDRRKPRDLEFITRFDLQGFYDGISDISALELVLKAGGTVRGIRGLHAKLFLFDRRRVIAGSANLTEAGLSKNCEFGFVADKTEIIDQCHQYFAKLWRVSGADLTLSDLSSWGNQIDQARCVRSAKGPSLPDFGADASGLAETSPFVEHESPITDGTQFFVKFFGSGSDRVSVTDPISEHVERGGCHWACTYGKRPRNVGDGATMFMARLTRNPNDIHIFGQAIGRRHRDGVDDASPDEIRKRSWKAKWPYYVRVHSPKFIDGRLSDGISLNALMKLFGSDAFISTQKNAAKGSGNINPRLSLSQQPQIALTHKAAAWLAKELDEAFRIHGTLDLTADAFDRPPVV